MLFGGAGIFFFVFFILRFFLRAGGGLGTARLCIWLCCAVPLCTIQVQHLIFCVLGTGVVTRGGGAGVAREGVVERGEGPAFVSCRTG